MPKKMISLMAAMAVVMILSGAATADFVAVDDVISDPSSSILDPEFDVIGNHMVWQDGSGNMWLSKIDPVNGDVYPADGKGTLLDTGLTNGLITGNGPEWGYSSGTPLIAYTRNLLGTIGLARARQDIDGAWMADRLVRPLERWRPEGTHPSHNGPMRIAYNYTANGVDLVGWRNIEDQASEGTIEGQMAQGGRWLEGTDSILTMVIDNGTVQVGMTDINDGITHVVTRGNRKKLNGFGWWAPEFNEPLFSVMLDARKVAIFRQADAHLWTLYYTVHLPTDKQYVSSPEAFTVNGKSYIVVVAAEELGTAQFKFQPAGPSEIWIAGIDPAAPFFRRVDDPATVAQRSEPEMYTTAEGPVVYYTEKDEITGNKLLRRAATGLGPDLGYDYPGYGGSWAAMFRDNKNCNCTPFAIAEDYQEHTSWTLRVNRQGMRQTLGPEGNLYASILELGQAAPPPERFIALDPMSGAETWHLDQIDVGTSIVGTQNLIDEQGNIYLASQTHLNKFNNAGIKLWDTPIRGLPRSLQFAPDGNIVFFPWNGWVQIADPNNGIILFEKDLTPGRVYPDSMSCLAAGPLSGCSYIDAPATDFHASRVYQTLTTETGNGVIQAFEYTTSPSIDLVPLWTSAEFTGNVTSPVLSADHARIYVQDEAGLLSAIDTNSGGTAWNFPLGFTGAHEPAVTDHGFIMPGGKHSDDPELNYVGIVRDTGPTAEWAFQSLDYVAESLPGAGRGNRFAVGARRVSDGKLALLVMHPSYGIISETLLRASIPLPNELTGVTIRNDGWIFLGTTGRTTHRAYQPVYDITPPLAK
ncbi:MAG: PQQ-like beta-propeller repeat protein [Halobacteria archaeon]|nr:PQQ-like beta-propeller repeat protein [Halobacteria archaeon]